MTVRKFKPGDRVYKKGTGQTMIVLKYCFKQNPLTGSFLSDLDVECVWYENKRRKTGIFDQRTLSKVTTPPNYFSGIINKPYQICLNNGR